LHGCTFFQIVASRRFGFLLCFDVFRFIRIPLGWTENMLVGTDALGVEIHLTRALFTVFGSVVDGMDVIDKIERVGSQSGKTAKTVVIKDCGEL
jgi:cyclophilin family peptidyl-prolyl cis-trans isomerase